MSSLVASIALMYPLVHMQKKHRKIDKQYNLVLLLIILLCTPSSRANKVYLRESVGCISVGYSDYLN